eukprot:5582587-Alexandrium_andersonii.AAC.1
MSASLVGSEMCIRDSLSVPEKRPTSSLQGPCTGGFASCCAWNPMRISAVSYTHLTLPTICSV